MFSVGLFSIFFVSQLSWWINWFLLHLTIKLWYFTGPSYAISLAVLRWLVLFDLGLLHRLELSMEMLSLMIVRGLVQSLQFLPLGHWWIRSSMFSIYLREI